MREGDNGEGNDADAERDKDTAFHLGGILGGVLHGLGDVAILRGSQVGGGAVYGAEKPFSNLHAYRAEVIVGPQQMTRHMMPIGRVCRATCIMWTVFLESEQAHRKMMD